MRITLAISIFIVALIILADYTEPKYKIDLPEEINLAKETDTLICIKRGNTLVIEFNHKY